MARTVPDDQIIAKPARKVGPAEREVNKSMVQKQREYLESQPTVEIRVREEEGAQFVQFNGFGYRIYPSEEYIKVPRDVAIALRNKGAI